MDIPDDDMCVELLREEEMKRVEIKFSSEDLPPLSKSLYDYFEKCVLKYKDKINNYQLVIDGPISSGKSTILQYLFNIFSKYDFKIVNIPEYINVEPLIGPKLLTKYISSQITNSTFQNFILDVYRCESRKYKNTNYNLMFYERIPDDSIFIFANITNRNHPEDLNEQTLFSLYNKLLNYNVECNFPSYRDTNTHFSLVVGDIEDKLYSILDIIINDIDKGINKRIIGLSTDLETSILRIKRRGRVEELDYDKDYLNAIINAYNNIYKIKLLNIEKLKSVTNPDEIELINNVYSIRFTNIGRLIDPF